VVLALLFRRFLKPRLLHEAREVADRGVAGSMEGHAAMDMSVAGDGPFLRRLMSRAGFTSVSHVFVMEWAAILKDLVIGLFIAGAIAAWVPDSFWQHFFLSGHPVLAGVWGPLVGPLVAVVSFVCSIGNVPLALVLWKGGISFGGVTSFIFADLIILPILTIYKKYYGKRAAWFLLWTFFVAMAAAGYVIELLFTAFGWVPGRDGMTVMTEGVSWNYTTFLNIAFLVLAAVLTLRFFRSGGMAMLRMMGGAPDEHHDHAAHHDHAVHHDHTEHHEHSEHDHGHHH
jgi:uncharacterized membrane protein YraQ (UPF0718 family)